MTEILRRLLYSLLGAIYGVFSSLPTWGYRTLGGYVLPHLLERIAIFAFMGALVFSVMKGKVIRMLFDLVMEMSPSAPLNIGRPKAAIVFIMLVVVPAVAFGRILLESSEFLERVTPPAVTELFAFCLLMIGPHIVGIILAIIAGVGTYRNSERHDRWILLFAGYGAIAMVMYLVGDLAVYGQISRNAFPPLIGSVIVLLLWFHSQRR